jgi:hypothetical protein
MPLLAIPVDAFDEQLILRKQGSDDYGVDVVAGEHRRLVAGRILRVARASGRVAFFWSITGAAVPSARLGTSGEADDLDAAKVAFRHAFDEMLYWASAKGGGTLPWHVGAERLGG